MCEYCGCQALSAVAALTREHDDALHHVRLADKALEAADEVAARRACSDLRELLAPHTAVEEQALFPALRDDFPEQMEALHLEHLQVEAALDEAVDGPRDDGWQGRLTAALHVLRLHILKEQDGVFPAALSTLSTAQWEAVDAARESASPRVRQGLMEEVRGG